MFYQLRLIKGIFSPSYVSHQLRQAETIPRLWLKICLLIFSSGILFFIGAFFGLDNELFSKEIVSHSSSDFEAIKLLFALGKTLWGFVFAVLVLLVPAVFFWSVTDVSFVKLLSIQAFVLLILLIEKASKILLTLFFGIDKFSSPFSLGVITQYLTDRNLFIILFGSISIFLFWYMHVQYTYLKRLSEKNPRLLFLFVIGFNFFILIVSTLLYYMKIEKLI